MPLNRINRCQGQTGRVPNPEAWKCIQASLILLGKERQRERTGLGAGAGPPSWLRQATEQLSQAGSTANTEARRPCPQEDGKHRASDSNAAPTSVPPLGQSSAPEPTATGSFTAKQGLNPALIWQSCTAEKAAKLFSSCRSSSKAIALLLAALQPLSNVPGKETGRENLFNTHLLP